MRHDDRANRPDVDPAHGPSSGERGSSGADLYVPGEGEIELIDQAEQTEEDEEMVPSDSELQLTDDAQPYEQGYGGEQAAGYAEGGEQVAPGDAEAPLDFGGLAPEFVSQEPLFDARGELIVEAGFDGPAEGRVSVPPSRPPEGGDRGADMPHIPPPPALPSEGSPWAADSEAAIDAGALPSSHSPVLPQSKPPAPPAASEQAGSSRSWLTIFLVIAVVAFGLTFLILFFNVGQTPQAPPGAGAPIQVPQSAPSAAPANVAPPQPVVTTPPVNTAPEPPAGSAAAAPSAAPSAEPIDLDAPAGTALSIPTVMVTGAPADGATGAPATPSSSKTVGPTNKPPKKTTRIF